MGARTQKRPDTRQQAASGCLSRYRVRGLVSTPSVEPRALVRSAEGRAVDRGEQATGMGLRSVIDAELAVAAFE